MSEPKAISSYEVRNGKVYVSTPFCQRVVTDCRAWGGRYNSHDRVWELSATRLLDIEKLIGRDQHDLVQVEVNGLQWQGSAQIYVGWHVLAGRRNRDYRANLYAELVQGEVPPTGGSMKYPAVDATEDAVFRFWVPRDFARERDLYIVSDPAVIENAPLGASAKALNVERVRTLMAELGVTVADLSEGLSVVRSGPVQSPVMALLAPVANGTHGVPDEPAESFMQEEDAPLDGEDGVLGYVDDEEIPF